MYIDLIMACMQCRASDNMQQNLDTWPHAKAGTSMPIQTPWHLRSCCRNSSEEVSANCSAARGGTGVIPADLVIQSTGLLIDKREIKQSTRAATLRRTAVNTRHTIPYIAQDEFNCRIALCLTCLSQYGNN